MTSTALCSIAKRAAEYTVIDRRNQMSKICMFAAEDTNFRMSAKNPDYIIC